jgi:arylsulfatase A-like enzyme
VSPPRTADPAAKPAGPSRPSLILITSEGLRPDRLACYREKNATATPNIDSLAAEGRLFDQVLASSTSSVASLATLFTGRTPFQHQVWDDHYRNHLAPGPLTLAQRLKKAGYRTGAFVATSRLEADRGLDRGFDLYQDGTLVPPDGVWKLIQRLGPKLTPGAKSWIEGAGEGPFFLWMHFIETSIPAGHTQTQSAEAAESTSYAKRVAQFDAQVGEIMKILKDAGRYESSVIVVTADHGMGLGEHGEWRAGIFAYDTTIRVPLVIKTPSGDPGKGTRSHDLAGTVDLFPTLERILRLSPTPGLSGRDLLSSPPSPAPAYYAVSLMGREIFGWSGQELVARGSRRLITGSATELYDVASDPGEEKNLAASSASEVRALQEQRTRLSGGTTVPSAHFQPGTGLPQEMAKRLAAFGLASPTPGNARARILPDPHRFVSGLHLLEIAAPGVDLIGFPAIKEVRAELLKDDPEGLFTLSNISQLDFAQDGQTPGKLPEVAAFVRIFQKIYPLEPESYHMLGHIAAAQAKYGDAELLFKAAGSLGPRNPAEVSYDLACAYAREGKKETALSELRKSIRLGFKDAPHISIDPDLDSLRQDPAFKSLIREELPAAQGQ